MKDERGISGDKPEMGEAAWGQTTGHTATLVIVLTLEEGSAAGESQWQWRVRSVETGAEAHFRRVADMLAFVAAVSGQAAPL